MTSAYTPLETLLLFSALRAEGTGNAATTNFSFNRISEQLKSISLIRNDPSYDGGRLSPDALREQYLWLLKEEAKLDLERATASRTSSPTTTRSPTEISATHLIPQVVGKLYATYREKTIKEIRECERKYDALSRDITEIEAGKWDERLQRNVSALRSPKPSTSAHTQPALQRADIAQSAQNGTATPTSPQRPVDPTTQAPPKRYSQAKIDAVMNHGPEPQLGHGGHRRTSSNTTLPPLSEMAPQSPRFGIPPLPGPVTAMGMQPPYNQSPPVSHQSPYAPHHGHPAASPQLQNTMSRPSSSPRPILPPPPGMKLPPPSPIQHATSPGMRGPPIQPQQHYQQQHRGSIGPSPINDRPPHPYPPPQLPPPGGYYPQQQPYPDRRTSYPPPQPQPTQRYPAQAPHQGGYQLQPWVVDGQQPGRPQHKQQQQPLPQQQTQRPQQSPAHAQRPPSYPQYPSAPPTTARQPAPVQPRLVTDIITALATPPRAERKPVWKSERRPPPLKIPGSPPAPAYEPLSPVQQRTQPSARASRPTRRRDAAPSVEHADPELAAPRTRRRQTRNRSPQSAVSSSADDLARTHTRSQSVSTVTGALQQAEERPSSRGKVKAEPSTPAEMLEAPDHALEPSATPASGRMTRKRRGTLQSQPQPPPKRKRQQSPSVEQDVDVEANGTPPPRPTTVTATRNFAKMTAMIMNDIESHKYGTYFKVPVRDKDASGYSEIIKQPQHLKSIRTAIIAGTRAVAAATSIMESPSATDGSATVELERTADLIPPKAIVNGAQLEKEVYRMFANAVMFNPGEDGLVADTREMFEDVEAKVREWRGADVGGEEEEEAKGKRRKL